MQFNSYFSKDVDVFSSVKWEKRTASIISANGDKVFYQENVEVPEFFSQTATNVLASKYFRGKQGTPERETSFKQVITRIVNKFIQWGNEGNYFGSREDATIFENELKYILLNQVAAFNSPVWFNLGWEGRNQAISACYINQVDDTMESILDLYKTEGMLFKDGSGSGVNLSNLRSSKESLSAGGVSSGPISFMRGLDANAGSIKSGGSTRRAALMRVLDDRHPDIISFIDCKKDAELKAHALIEAGYSGAFNVNGGAYDTVPFQNANNSVRLSDEFMQAVKEDGDWWTQEVISGNRVEKFKARDILRKIAEGTWVCGDPGVQFDDTINDWHTCLNTDRIYSSNPCSEYMFLNNTACNLASINLLKFFNDDTQDFNIEGFKHTIDILITAQDIGVGAANYPTTTIQENSIKYRTLGLGYANLGALLMRCGLSYDSDEGRYLAAQITALMTGESYLQSAKLAKELGAFSEFNFNRSSMLKVIDKHIESVDKLKKLSKKSNLLEESYAVWSGEVKKLGEITGFRNAQVTVLAPTGTIGFLMDCDTTGIEPDLALVKYKTLVGGGSMKLVNQSIPTVLKHLKYSEKDIKSIIDYISDNDTIEGSPLKEEHLPIFDCAFKPVNGQRSLHYMSHLKMMAATQPFLSGAISKTVNMPTTATVEEISEVYTTAWNLGLKAVAIYRDGSKKTQPLTTGKSTDRKEEKGLKETKVRRKRLSEERRSLTHKFSIGGHEGYITAGLYDDGTVGEVFIHTSKSGSTINGLLDAWATSVSLALQYGVPLKTIVDKFSFTRFQPSGFTTNSDIPMSTSIIDYLSRWLSLKFLNQNLGPKKVVKEAEEMEAGVAGTFVNQSDAPACPNCGSITVRNGSCYKCSVCGTSLGCS